MLGLFLTNDIDRHHVILRDGKDLEKILENNKANGLRNIVIPPVEGNFLYLVARSIRAKRILEVDTLGGQFYSTAWLARAVPEDGGTVTTLDMDPHCVQVATEDLTAAGLIHKVNIILGRSAETLETLSPVPAPFDFVFIDADSQNVTYFKHAKRLLRKGGIVDNVVQNGNVSDPENKERMVEGARSLLEVIETDPEVSATTISAVGERGYDGFTYILKTLSIN